MPVVIIALTEVSIYLIVSLCQEPYQEFTLIHLFHSYLNFVKYVLLNSIHRWEKWGLEWIVQSYMIMNRGEALNPGHLTPKFPFFLFHYWIFCEMTRVGHGRETWRWRDLKSCQVQETQQLEVSSWRREGGSKVGLEGPHSHAPSQGLWLQQTLDMFPSDTKWANGWAITRYPSVLSYLAFMGSLPNS